MSKSIQNPHDIMIESDRSTKLTRDVPIVFKTPLPHYRKPDSLIEKDTDIWGNEYSERSSTTQRMTSRDMGLTRNLYLKHGITVTKSSPSLLISAIIILQT